MKYLEQILAWGGIKRELAFLIISGIALAASIAGFPALPFDAAWVAIILCGMPIILEAVIGLVTSFDIKADVLVSLALVASVLIGEDFAAGEVAFIMQLGGLLEDLTVAKARAGIEKLVHLTPRTARRVTPQGEETVDAQAVQVGDVLRVLPGEAVPVDGVIISGQTSIDQAVMTGESLPVDKAEGDEVASGTVNQFGAFDMRATRVGKDSSIQRMVPLGHLDCGDCIVQLSADMAGDRRNFACCDNSCGVLPLRAGACHAHGHYGGHWQCHKVWLSGARGRCAGTAGIGCQSGL